MALKREAQNHLALAPNIYQPHLHISFFVFLPKFNHIRYAHGLSLRNFLTSHESTKLKLSWNLYRFMMFHGLHLRPITIVTCKTLCKDRMSIQSSAWSKSLGCCVTGVEKFCPEKTLNFIMAKGPMIIRKAEVGKVCQCYWPYMSLRLNKMTLHSDPSSPPNTPSLTNHIIHAYPCHATPVWQVSLSSKLDLHFPTTTSKKWQNKKRHFGSVHCWVWPRTAEGPANTWNSFKTMFKSIAGWFESGQFCCVLLLC